MGSKIGSETTLIEIKWVANNFLNVSVSSLGVAVLDLNIHQHQPVLQLWTMQLKNSPRTSVALIGAGTQGRRLAYMVNHTEMYESLVTHG